VPLSSKATIRILLADDHRLLREGLRGILAAQNGLLVCAEAADGEAAWHAIEREKPDVAVLDHSMPVCSGIDVLKKMQQAGLGTRGIILSSFAAPMLVAEALRAGAGGYLIKDSAAEEVVAAIRAVAAGKTYLSRGIDTAALNEAMHILPVSDRQGEVLDALLEGRSAAETATQLGISPRTVETYRNQLIGKFSARNALHLIRRALDAGFGTPRKPSS
jgi:DNA-binding NarL/FixJ family response regulator